MTARATRFAAAVATVGALAAMAAACGGDRSGGDGLPESQLSALLAESVTLEGADRVFAAMALLNAAGYDEERGAEMHPVRRDVRGALPRLMHDSVFTRLDQFYQRALGRASPTAMVEVALATSGLPDFSLPPDYAFTGNARADALLAEFPGLLRLFARAFPLDSMWRVHQAAHAQYRADIASVIRRETGAALRYLRVRDTSALAARAPYVLIPSLLVSHDVTLGWRSRRVVGPARPLAFEPREFVAAAVRATFADSLIPASAIARADIPCPRSLPADTPDAPCPYAAARAESQLAMAILIRYRATRDAARDAALTEQVVAAARRGAVLVPYFYAQLERYEQQDLPFREYAVRMFDDLDGRREAARWRREGANQPSGGAGPPIIPARFARASRP